MSTPLAAGAWTRSGLTKRRCRLVHPRQQRCAMHRMSGTLTRVGPAFVRCGARKEAATRSREAPPRKTIGGVIPVDRGKAARHASEAAAQRVARASPGLRRRRASEPNPLCRHYCGDGCVQPRRRTLAPVRPSPLVFDVWDVADDRTRSRRDPDQHVPQVQPGGNGSGLRCLTGRRAGNAD